MNRRQFLAGTALGLGAAAFGQGAGSAATGRRPNIVFIITDDQGYGDLGCHGNPHVRTPNIDRLRGQGIWFNRFYASPVCSPTRSSIMTGRYNYRTGIVDTFMGRSMMFPDEVTLAEVLRDNGYATGIFGKWHLGDTYPLRAMDQGFQEALVHNGGGLAQASDYPGNTYLNPMLLHNGQWERYEGYCTDVFGEATVGFIEANREKPFFAYFATNAPHSPLQVEEKHIEPYRAMGLDEETARIYGMITNIDANVGKVLGKLDELRLADNTIVLFMTDNGAYMPFPRHNAGMRGTKGTAYEGGIRVPLFVRWPAGLGSGRGVNTVAAHIDLMPTLLEACGAALPEGVRIDGRSLLPLLRGENVQWPERTLYFQWHRGDAPEPFRNCAAVTQQYKLVEGKELYDLQADPGEKTDLAAQHPDIVERMRKGYEEWFADVGSTRGYAPPRIQLGTPHENPVTLTRQDWRGTTGWSDQFLGYWEVEVTQPGPYDVTLRFAPANGPTDIGLRVGDLERTVQAVRGQERVVLEGLDLPQGPQTLHAWLSKPDGKTGVRYVDVLRTLR